MNIFYLAALSIVTILIIGILKQWNANFAIYIGLAASLIALLFIIPKLSEIIEFIRSIANQNSIITENVNLVIKALGISIVTEFASDTCKSSGENNLANIVEMGGKIAIITIALPLINKLIILIRTILG